MMPRTSPFRSSTSSRAATSDLGSVASPAPTPVIPSASLPFSRASASGQVFLVAVFVSSMFSLGLNIYLSSKLGVLSDNNSLQANLKQAFLQPRILPGENQILTAAEAHGNEYEQHLDAARQAVDHVALPADSQEKGGAHGGHNLAGLYCEAYGGPPQQEAEEMVYWEDIPSDNKWISPFKQSSITQYLTFEPDGGGWYVVLVGITFHPSNSVQEPFLTLALACLCNVGTIYVWTWRPSWPWRLPWVEHSCCHQNRYFTYWTKPRAGTEASKNKPFLFRTFSTWNPFTPNIKGLISFP
jgi:hypothetical protein